MRTHSFALLLAGFLVSCGSRSSKSGEEIGKGAFGDRQGQNVLPQVYEDVVEPSGTKVPIGKWPAQLNAQGLVEACRDGEIAYLDRCWSSILIDVDAKNVTFLGNTGESKVIAIGQPLPAELGMVPVATRLFKKDRITVYSQYPQVARYRQLWNSCSSHDVQSATSTLWGMFGLGQEGVPWATSFCFWTSQPEGKSESLSVFGVRAIFAFGMVNDGSPYSAKIAHQWHYTGTLRVNGKDFSLPVKVSDVAAATGVAEQNFGGVERRLLFKTAHGAVEFVANSWLHGAQVRTGLSDELLYVSDVWFYDEGVGI